MAVTSFLRDHLLRPLVNPTPGTSDATDYIGRPTVAGDVDYVGRALIVTAWAVATAYGDGDYVELSTGEVLKVVTGGTSDATIEPTAPGYGNTVVDGTVTWEQVTA